MSDKRSSGVGAFVPFHNPPKGKASGNVGWIVAANGCHVWQGARNPKGYGQVRHEGRQQRVHRARYEREVGPIPEGMDLDHFACDNPLCCNPAHVRPATHRENLLRGNTITAEQAARTHCALGHPLSGENLYVWRGRRVCRACVRLRGKRWRRKQRLEKKRATLSGSKHE